MDDTILNVIALRLYAHGLEALHDPNWTGGDLYDRIKVHVRGRIEPYDLLRRPLERGLVYHVGLWVFEDFFDVEREPPHMMRMEPEYQAWYLEDVSEFLLFHGLEGGEGPTVYYVHELTDELGGLFDRNEGDYYERLANLAEDESFEVYLDCYETHEDSLERLAPLYAAAFGDRVLHDRELCAYLAELLLVIGFDGDREDGHGSRRWVDRVRWPERVKGILRARDRGRCSECGNALVLELEGEPHIDHIVPIAVGGCNDLVNLQVLCAECNIRTGQDTSPVRSSVPRYIRIRHR